MTCPRCCAGETPPFHPVTEPLPGFAAPGVADPAARWEPADLRALRVECSRDFGEYYLELSLWHRLGLDSLLAERLPSGRESVGWAHTAALLTVARFYAQPSELGVAEHWYYPKTGDVSSVRRGDYGRTRVRETV